LRALFSRSEVAVTRYLSNICGSPFTNTTVKPQQPLYILYAAEYMVHLFANRTDSCMQIVVELVAEVRMLDLAAAVNKQLCSLS